MSPAAIDELARMVVLLAVCGGALGSFLTLGVLALFRLITESRPSQAFPKLHQSGRANLPLVLWLAAVCVAALAACSQPEAPVYPEQWPGHQRFIDAAKAGW